MNKDTDILLTAEAVRHTYRERNKVIIVGLTGRTGSGCTTLSKILATKKFACILRTSCHVYTVKLPHRNGVLATVARQLPHYLYNI